GPMYASESGAPERATRAYGRRPAADPHSPATARQAATALARLYEEEERWKDLVGIVRRQAEGADSADERNHLLTRVAHLEEERLGDRAAAIASWREILAEDPDHPAALDALERLYQGSSSWPELVEILRRRVGQSGPDVAK